MMRYFETTILVRIAAGLLSWALLFVVGAMLGCMAVWPAQADLAAYPAGYSGHNGDIGIILWGPNNRPTLSVGKSDVWDRRYLEKAPVATLADIKRWAKTGKFPERHYEAYSAYDFPCPKPVGQLILGLPGAAEDWTLTAWNDQAGKSQSVGTTIIEDHWGLQQWVPGAMTLRATRGEQRLELRIYVHGGRNLLIIAGEASQAIEGLWFRLYRHQDSLELGTTYFGKIRFDYDYSQDENNGPMAPPTAGYEGEMGWVNQLFPAEPTFPDGFRYTFAAVTSVKGVRVESVAGQRGLGTAAYSPRERVEAGDWVKEGLPDHYTGINKTEGAAATFHLPRVEGRFRILVTVVTSTDTEDTVNLAKEKLAEALAESPADLWASHCAALRDPRHPFLTRKPGGYYSDIPCSMATWLHASKFSMQDSAPWHADFHFDEQQYARHYFVGNRAGHLEPYFQLIEQMLPGAQKNAREVYNCPGAMFGIVHYPIRTDSVVHTTVVWEQIMEITALNIKPFWEHFLYTGDLEFLRQRGYPMMREGARFYAAYVTPEEDGYFHVVPTVSPEHWSLTKNFERNKDSQSALTMIKYLLHGAAQAAEILGQDEEEREVWAHISRNMAPYPTYDTPDGPIFVDVRGAPLREYNIPVPLTAIWWGDDITLESPPEVLELARRTLDHIAVWAHGSHSKYSMRCRVLLGEYVDYVGGDNITVEHMLQSRGGWDMVKKRGGWIRVFPAVPDDYTGSFQNYLAIGAFEVDAACEDGTVAELTIHSRVGNTCQLVNPWPGQTLVVKETESGETARLAGGYIRFPTRAGYTYLIEPATS